MLLVSVVNKNKASVSGGCWDWVAATVGSPKQIMKFDFISLSVFHNKFYVCTTAIFIMHLYNRKPYSDSDICITKRKEIFVEECAAFC